MAGVVRRWPGAGQTKAAAASDSEGAGIPSGGGGGGESLSWREAALMQRIHELEDRLEAVNSHPTSPPNGGEALSDQGRQTVYGV